MSGVSLTRRFRWRQYNASVYTGDVVPVNGQEFELIWSRLEDAKLHLDLCHNYIKEIWQDKASGAVPESDGNLAHKHALRAQETALDRYLHALHDLKMALALEIPAPPHRPRTDG